MVGVLSLHSLNCPFRVSSIDNVSLMKRTCVIFCCVLLIGCLFWLFPLFHVVRIEQFKNSPHEPVFNAADFSKSFWSERLIPSLAQAPDAATVLKAFQANPDTTRERFGRKVGVSRTRLIVFRGSGTIATIDKTGVGVALDDKTKKADIVLQTGLLFGNIVRDATGLLDASNFPDSRQFNEISTELNRIIEARVIPVLKDHAVVGAKILFAGCAEISDQSPIDVPLKIVPLEARVE